VVAIKKFLAQDVGEASETQNFVILDVRHVRCLDTDVSGLPIRSILTLENGTDR
jgi:hypothetical protein